MSGAGSRSPGRRKLNAPSFAEEQADEVMAAKEKAEARKAELASIREAFTPYDTELIRVWGIDHAGYEELLGAKTSRSNTIDTLAKLEGDLRVPKDVAAMKANYRYHIDREWEGSGLHPAPKRKLPAPVVEVPDDPGAEVESEVEESAPPDRKKPRVDTTPAKLDKHTRAECPHCLEDDQLVFCGKCFRRRDQAYDSPQNMDLARKGEERPGTLAPATQADARGTLGDHDRELQRIARDGEPFPRFSRDVSVSAAEAIVASRLAYGGRAFAHMSGEQINLIQSGKLAHIALATPITSGQQRQGHAVANAAFIQEGGQFKIAKGFSIPPLANMHQFLFTLLGAILPALLEQQGGLCDWLVLGRTVVELNEEKGWDKARTYLERVLADKVHMRESFGELDRHILDSVLDAPAPRDRSRRDRDEPPAAATKAPRAKAPASTKERCFQFNSVGGCRRGEQHCRLSHTCTGCGGAHSLAHCPDGAPDARGGFKGRQQAASYFGAAVPNRA